MPASPCAAAQWEADPGARAFYETAATAAAALGVRVDVFAACGGPCGLDALEPLAAGSGGAAAGARQRPRPVPPRLHPPGRFLWVFIGCSQL